MKQLESVVAAATPRLGRKHNPAIDSLKGALILLVMVGHAFVEGMDENPAKWLIYGFHMPLFFGLSGYLLNLSSLRESAARVSVDRYWRRLVLPWIPAFLLFTALTLDHHDVRSLVNAVLRPPHHLWFVPVLCFFVATSFLYKGSRTHLFISSAILGVIGLLMFGVGRQAGSLTSIPLPDPRYVTMAPFFFFGLFLAGRAAFKPIPMVAVALLALIAWQILYYYTADSLSVAPYMIQNLAMISLIPTILKTRISVPVLREVGVDSFYFYLWHPFIFIAAKRILDRRVAYPVEFVLIPVCTLVIMFLVLHLIKRSTWLCLVSGAIAPASASHSVASAGAARA